MQPIKENINVNEYKLNEIDRLAIYANDTNINSYIKVLSYIEANNLQEIFFKFLLAYLVSNGLNYSLLDNEIKDCKNPVNKIHNLLLNFFQ